MSKLLNKLGIIMLLLSSTSFAEYSIDYAKTSLINDMYILDARLNFNLTEVAIE
ncbi:MAG: hypothetical protein IMF12_04705, partial [Proteobacteria bacterium]|nr:hypothetical protein [Pseudomonadota bacterium]